MRHSKRRHILGVSSSHRSAMLGNLSVALITHGRIKTTLAKAKALRPFIEKIITLAKKADQANDAARKLHFRRLAIARVRDKKAVAELFDNKVSEFSNRAGGYTRIYKLGQRVGDAAEMGLIELIDANDEGYPKRPKKKATKSETKAKAKAESEAEEVVEEVVEDAEQAEATEESSEAVEPEAEVAEADADAEEAAKKD
ncbi:MAG: 50S ribosomal protein L17 [Puniceicoccaceae bacterium MED-G32]|mgnify:FL=1|nr:MAG: 50S ribosomal protein L17 [Puniceicoccaceae bacterium MED-G32]|tara:strand:+ start:14794 stop:15390 length:597 start_codon:yes stop_codon:yes gene_type:complete